MGDLDLYQELREARRRPDRDRQVTVRRGVVTASGEVDGLPAERATGDTLPVGAVVILLVVDGGRTVIGRVRDW